MVTTLNVNNSVNISPQMNSPQKNSGVLAAPPAQQEGDKITEQIVLGLNDISGQISLLNNWTKGGSAVIANILQVMFENITKKNNFVDTDFEDLLQLAYLDMQQRGTLPGTTSSYILEAAGSGNHTSGGYVKGTQLQSLFDAAGNEPISSLAHQVNDFIKNIKNNPLPFDDFITNYEKNYWSSPQGFMDGSAGDSTHPALAPQIPSSTEYGPWLKLLILSTYIHAHPQTSTDDYMKIVNGNSTSIKTLINLKGSDTILKWIEDNQSSELPRIIHTYDTQKPELNGAIIKQGFLDIVGSGVDSIFVNALLTKFPPRELTEEEVRKVNQCGDNAKVLYELLKMRLTTSRDVSVQIAQNI